MSQTALRKLSNNPLVSERRTVAGKKATMKVLLAGPNDENLNINQANTRCLQRSPASRPARNGFQVPADAVAEPNLQEIEYILSEDLKAVEDVDDEVNTLLDRLDSKEWTTVLEALNTVRQISIFHSSAIVDILGKIVCLVIKAMKNPRSALIKTSVMASADLFKAYRDQMLEALDSLLLQLLLKASQDKKFVCEEAERALCVMTSSMSPIPLLEKLLPYLTHRNPRVRAKASMCVYQSVSKLGVAGIKEYGVEHLITIAAGRLNDQLPEAREAARKLVLDLYAAYQEGALDEELEVPPQTGLTAEPKETVQSSSEAEVDEQESPAYKSPWERFCLSKLPQTTAQAVFRITCIAN